MKSQPKGAAPVSREVVEGVKRKMAAPAGPPPAGMTNFIAPKNLAAKPTQSNSRYDEYDNDNYDDYHGDYRDDNYDEGDDYYADGRDDRNRRDRSRDSYEDDRDYRYDGGNDRLDDDDSRNRTKYNDQTANRGGRDSRDDHSNTREDDRYQGRSNERSEQPAPNAHAQSKQYSAPNPHASSADSKAAADNDSKLVSAERRDLNAPTGTAVQVINAYLQRSRTTLLSYQPVLRATYRELKYYVTSPCPPGFTARCYIERNRSGSKMLAPYYSICADLDDGTGRELMVCRKVLQSRSPHYIFSLKSEDLWRKREQRSRLYLGKLRATSSQDYVLYDNGICEAPEEPESLLLERERDSGGDFESSADRDTVLSKKMARDRKASAGDGGNAGTASADEVSLYRSELLAVHFNCKSRPAPNGKRGTEVCIPHNFAVDSSGKTSILGKAVSPPSSGSLPAAGLADPKSVHSIGITKNTAMYNIVKPFEKVRDTDRQNDLYAKSCFVMHERTSRYDPLSSCLVDFKGRANMASVKNCQFVVSEPASDASGSAEAQMKGDAEKDFVLQLGKTTDDCFNMDYRYPLNLLQAFAICIARFDAKLTW